MITFYRDFPKLPVLDADSGNLIAKTSIAFFRKKSLGFAGLAVFVEEDKAYFLDASEVVSASETEIYIKFKRRHWAGEFRLTGEEGIDVFEKVFRDFEMKGSLMHISSVSTDPLDGHFLKWNITEKARPRFLFEEEKANKPRFSFAQMPVNNVTSSCRFHFDETAKPDENSNKNLNEIIENLSLKQKEELFLYLKSIIEAEAKTEYVKSESPETESFENESFENELIEAEPIKPLIAEEEPITAQKKEATRFSEDVYYKDTTPEEFLNSIQGLIDNFPQKKTLIEPEIPKLVREEIISEPKASELLREENIFEPKEQNIEQKIEPKIEKKTEDYYIPNVNYQKQLQKRNASQILGMSLFFTACYLYSLV